ncbi:MAG: FIST N-terminal domain-containing protein [Treponema sp.]
MTQEVVKSSRAGSDEAVKELVSQLKKPLSEYKAVLFFASSSYEFAEMSVQIKQNFPNAEVIGTSTSGEISNYGFAKNSVVLTALTCTKTQFAGFILHDVDKYPITQKNSILDAARKCGIMLESTESHKNSFAITFVNGLCNAEEALLSLLYAFIKDDKFIVAGGSAGDDLKFKQTFVSYNGETVSNGAVVLFVKTYGSFDIRKENIFTPSGKLINITQADTYSRKIISLDGVNPKKRYAEALGLTESAISDAVLSHPFGRVFGGKMFISSIAGFNNDGTINMYSRVLPNSTVELLNPLVPEEIAKKTSESILQEIPKPDCVIVINCILRTIMFEQQNKTNLLLSNFKRTFPVFCGFSSYGEQIGKINSNQTLVTIAIGE